MKTKLCTVKIHSIVDLITNSSTELFCTVKAKSEEEINKVIATILEECGCNAIEEIYAEPHICWDEDSPNYNK